jgi:hypothetical protein
MRSRGPVNKSQRKSGTGKTTKPTRKSSAAGVITHRKVIVFFSLAGVLSLTTILLRAMAPSPMMPDAVNLLVNPGSSDLLESINRTRHPMQAERWQYIYIHQSKTASGAEWSGEQAPRGYADHFVIGTGDGCVDGELQINDRWYQQTPAAPPAGAHDIDPSCISICMIGDFDKHPPTPIQMGRLEQVVQMLQSRFQISPRRVILMNEQANSPMGLGRYFPSSAFHDQLYTKPAVN